MRNGTLDCHEIKQVLGQWLDGELPDADRSTVVSHLGTCADCQAEYESLQSMAAVLAQPPTEAPPASIWHAIEARLDGTTRATTGHTERTGRDRWVFRFPRRPLAAAAAILLVSGLGWLSWNTPWESHAAAAEIDFRPLLEQADGDIKAGIDALIKSYGGKPIGLADAEREMTVRVHAPDILPGNLKLSARYMLSMGRHHRSLAFHFEGPAGHLLLLQCPPKIKKAYGNHECLPCRVGSHDGHGTRVGKLYLMHMTSENICLCIVTTLDEHEELPAALKAIRIDF